MNKEEYIELQLKTFKLQEYEMFLKSRIKKLIFS